MREIAKAKRAFEDFYNLGPQRSLDKLFEEYRSQPKAEAPTRRRATLGKWSRVHGWQARVEQRDAEIALAQFEEIKRLATHTGYAVWQKRIWDLNKLAVMLFEEIQEEDKRWLPDVKQVGSGEDAERVDIVRFNSPLLIQFRETLNDLAKEMGERVQGVAIAADIQVRDMDAVRERRWQGVGSALQQALGGGGSVDADIVEGVFQEADEE